MPGWSRSTGSSAIARLPVEIDVASEFRYRDPPLPETGSPMFVSQSGETADTLAGLRYCKEQGSTRWPSSMCANPPSRGNPARLPTLAGPEIGVASTKAFTCQLATLACLAIAAGRARGVFLDAQDEQKLVAALTEVPRLLSEALKLKIEIEELAKELSRARDVLYLGRGFSFPIALEGALKLKEISYIHAEGYAAGELKHGRSR
jgi:glutamine---fructose-6-phosphate transaminase (isomerizing)